MIWTTSNNKKIDIKDMTSGHLLNAYRVVCERIIAHRDYMRTSGEYDREERELADRFEKSDRAFKREIKKRGLTPLQPRYPDILSKQEVDKLFNQAVHKQIRFLKRDMG